MKNLLLKLIAPKFLKPILEADVVVFCQDIHRSIVKEKLAYSPLVDSFVEILQENNLKVVSVTLSGNRLVGEKAFNNPIIIPEERKIKVFSNKIIQK